MNRISVLASGVLCVLSVLVLGAVIGVGFSSMCVCNDDIAASYNCALLPGESEDRLDYRINDGDALDYRINDGDALDYRINDDDALDAAPDYGEDAPVGGQSALSALYFAYPH